MAIPTPPGFLPAANKPSEVTESPAAVNKNEMEFILSAELLPQHRTDPNVLRFISNYLRCRSPGQAAKEAGLPPQSGYALLRRTDIHRAIAKITQQAVMKYGYSAEEVVERVKEIGNLDPADVFNEDGSFHENIHSIPAEVRRAIKSMKVKNEYGKDLNGMPVVTGKILDIQFWDKTKAHELLGREKQIFKETKVHQHDVSKNMADTLLESKRRAEVDWRDVGPDETIETTAKDVSNGSE